MTVIGGASGLGWVACTMRTDLDKDSRGTGAAGGVNGELSAGF